MGPLDRERPITIDDNEAVDDDDNATTKKGFVRCWDGDVTQTRKWSRGEGWGLDTFALVPIGRGCEKLKFLGNVQQLIRLHVHINLSWYCFFEGHVLILILQPKFTS